MDQEQRTTHDRKLKLIKFIGDLYRFELLRAYLIDGFPPPRKAGEVSEFLWSVPVDLDGLRDGLM